MAYSSRLASSSCLESGVVQRPPRRFVCRRNILRHGVVQQGKQPRQRNPRATKQSELPLDDIQRTLLDSFQSEVIGAWTDAQPEAAGTLV